MPDSLAPERSIGIRSTLVALDPDRISRWIQFPTTRKFLWSAPGDRPVLALGTATVLTGNGLSRITNIQKSFDELKPTTIRNRSNREPPQLVRPRFFGALSFFRRQTLGDQWDQFQPGGFVLPRIQLLEGRDRTWATINLLKSEATTTDPDSIIRQLRRFNPPYETPGENSYHPGEKQPDTDAWTDRVEILQRECQSGSLQKIVPAQQRDVTLERLPSLSRLGRHLTEPESGTYGFVLQSGGRDLFVGASPEQLIAKHGEIVESESLAGTIASDDSADTRRDLADELSASDKDQREHHHVVDYLKNRLSPLVSSLETVPQSVRSLPTLQHLMTGFRGKLHSDHHVLELVRELHPTPAVAGRPSGQALSRLREIEEFDRGLYAGPIGWFDFEGNGEFAVAIRSARLRGRNASLFAGAGIVPGSQPEDEARELDLKFDSILRLLINRSVSDQ